jgi:hypothetical protein
MTKLKYRCAKLPHRRPWIEHEIGAESMEGSKLIICTPMLEDWSNVPFQLRMSVSKAGDVVLLRSIGAEPLHVGVDAQIVGR